MKVRASCTYEKMIAQKEVGVECKQTWQPKREGGE